MFSSPPVARIPTAHVGSRAAAHPQPQPQLEPQHHDNLLAMFAPFLNQDSSSVAGSMAKHRRSASNRTVVDEPHEMYESNIPSSSEVVVPGPLDRQ